MYNDQLVYKVVIWAYFGISFWKDKVALRYFSEGSGLAFNTPTDHDRSLPGPPQASLI